MKLPVDQARMSIADMGHRLDTFQALLQGAEGVTFGKQDTCTRTTESGSAILAVSAHRRALLNNRHISCSRDAVVERVTATVQNTWWAIENAMRMITPSLPLSVRKALSCRELYGGKG